MAKIIKKILINIALVLASLIFALILAEIVLRFTPYVKYSGTSRSHPRYHFVSDSELGYDINENFKGGVHNIREYKYDVFSNHYGCFDYERAVPKEYGLIVGDSFTWGYTPLDKKWTTLLEQKSGVFMLKCGVTGYGSKQELIKAKKVVKKVGINPKYIVVLYVDNDLNDDFVFPERNVQNGNLVNRVRSLDLVNGKVNFYSDKEVEARGKKFDPNTFQGWLRTLRYETVVYNTYLIVIKPQIRSFIDKIKHPSDSKIENAKNNPQNNTKKIAEQKMPAKKMPDFVEGSFGGVNLLDYLDNYDLPWYNKLVDDHKNTIKEMAKYASSIGAKLLLVDINGTLEHPRLKDVLSTKNIYYYDLTTDYPLSKRKTWKYDAHWNIEGNGEAGEYIYQHYRQAGLL